MTKRRKARFRVGQVVSWRGQEGQRYERIMKIAKDDCGKDLLHVGWYDFLIHPQEVRPLTARERGPAK